MDRIGPDSRRSLHSTPLWPTSAICISIIAAAFIARPGDRCPSPILLRFVETREPPLADPVIGPFRPRPTPSPDPPPPVPENDLERRLFPRLESWLDARAKRIEDRAQACAENRVNDALDEVTANLDAAILGADPELMQGAFGALFVAKLLTFVKAAVRLVILGTLGGLIYLYWPWIAGACALLIGLLRLWIGSIVAKAKS